MVARQISFLEGKIELMGQRVVIAPSEFFANYIVGMNENSELIYGIYNAAKQIMRERFGVNLGKNYGFSFKDYATWFVDIAKLSGWGDVRWENRDEANHKGIISIGDSPIAGYLKGKVKYPCDHIIRGLMAGGACSAFVDEVDIIETECSALGTSRCKFIIDKYDVLKNNFPDLAKQQLGTK